MAYETVLLYLASYQPYPYKNFMPQGEIPNGIGPEKVEELFISLLKDIQAIHDILLQR
jgi:hypothetical protein